MKGEDVKDFFIVGIDIAKYSLKPLDAQKGAQVAIDRALKEALRDGVPKKREQPKWLDAGDGGYALFEWSGGRDVFDVIKLFSEIMSRDNAKMAVEHCVSVRVALHYGQVLCWKSELGNRYTSDAINQCARFLAGMSRDPGRIVCSEVFLKKINAIDEIASAVRLKDVVDKHGVAHRIYNLHQIPGLGLPPKEEDQHENPFV